MYSTNKTQFKNFEIIPFNSEIKPKLPKLKLDTTKIIKIDSAIKTKNKKLIARISAQKAIDYNPELQTIYGGVKKFFVFILNTSSIHGLNHLTRRNRHPIEIIIWLFFVGFALFGSVYLSFGTWKRYQDNPIVVSMERDKFSWNTSFPAATICPSYKINDKKLNNEISKFNFTNKEKAVEFINALANASYRTFQEIPEFNEIDSNDYVKILVEYGFIFEPSVTNSGTSGVEYFLEKIVTEMGICYTFNSKLAKYSTLEYWNSNQWKLVPVNDTFYVHPLDGEVFTNVVNMSTGFAMYIHGPEETVDITSKNIYSENGYFLQVYLSALTLFTSYSAGNLSIQQRKCRFSHESNLLHSPVYSYTLCRIDCRIQLCLKLCGCIPHFYRPRAGEKICDVKGLHCLSKYAEKLLTLTEENSVPNTPNQCACLPNCDEVTYVVEFMETREWFLGSNLQWGLKEYPRMRLKRDVLFAFIDVLVYVGGMAGLFLGCSVLSFAEIFYFLTIRLYRFVVDYRKENKVNVKK